MTEIEDRTSPAVIPQHLRDTLYTAQQDHLASLDGLRAAVCDYVDELRGRGASYDDTARAVRNLVGQLAGNVPRSPDAMKQNGHLVETILHWCKDRWKQ